MVLLQFWDSKTASDFYVNYNDTPVSFQPALFPSVGMRECLHGAVCSDFSR